jgi:hypothetical protein
LRSAKADEAKLERLFGHFLPPEPPVRQPRFLGCIIEDRATHLPEPFPWQLDAEARGQLAGEYRAVAAIPLLDGFCSRCRLDPIESLAAQAWLRHAYLAIASYIDIGGRILLCPLGLAGTARWGMPWHIDRRRDASVEESFTGSCFRKPGLSPDRTPDRASVAALMMSSGRNAEDELDCDAEHDAATYFAVPKSIDLDTADPDDDVADDPHAGLTITHDDDGAS